MKKKESRQQKQSLVVLKDISVYYGEGSTRIEALKSINLEIGSGEMVAISGPSGSGKSTLLNVLGFLLKHDKGSIQFDGNEVVTSDFNSLADIRHDKIGFVFQGFNLIPVLTAIENVLVPLAVDGKPSGESHEQAVELLEAVGLGDQMNKKPDQLSGGQKQRVAIARALINQPRLVLADEPTANLDTKTAMNIMELMQKIHKKINTTFLFSAHDERILPYADRQIVIRDGAIISDKRGGRKKGS